MILTGQCIKKEVIKKRIIIDPFDEKQLNPNSYNYLLGQKLIFENGEEKKIPKKGLTLPAGSMVLGSTFETLGSKFYAMSLIGRSSIGRLGLFLQISANLGHTGSCHKWTLEIYSIRQIKLYPKMKIGQISFWCNHGKSQPYIGKYAQKNEPFPSLLISKSQ